MYKLAVISIISSNLECEPRVLAVKAILEHFGYHHIQYVDHAWFGWSSKLLFNVHMCHELTDFTHIMYVDARDVVVLAGPDEVMARWREFEHPWVYNAEPFIWSPNSFQPEDYPTPSTVYRYLNSGAYIAEREHLVRWFDKWVGKDGRGVPLHIPEGDQDWMAARFIEDYPDAIGLDLGCYLFQCMCGSLDGDEPRCIVTPGNVYNRITNTHPLIIHFNGGDDITAENRRELWQHLI